MSMMKYNKVLNSGKTGAQVENTKNFTPPPKKKWEKIHTTTIKMITIKNEEQREYLYTLLSNIHSQTNRHTYIHTYIIDQIGEKRSKNNKQARTSQVWYDVEKPQFNNNDIKRTYIYICQHSFNEMCFVLYVY